MKLLGIDFGTRRVGLAVTNPTGTIAFPLKTIHRTSRDALFDDLLRILDQEGIEAIVLGIPLAGYDTADGQEHLTIRQVRNFAASLGRRTSLPIHLMDEELSSFEAEDDLRQAGLTGNALKNTVDQQAAVRILQSFIDTPRSAETT
ncbi:MAG: Holliday junction resolvase RuvX [Desulfovibrionaceae bacterium]